MPLSARRANRRRVRAAVVGLPKRALASALDALVPTALLLVLIRTDAVSLERFDDYPELFALDRILLIAYQTPGAVLALPLTWMLLWTAVALIALGTVRTTPGKWILGLRIRQSDGRQARGGRLFRRVVAAWLVPATLGLAYLWIAVSPERRGWHDSLSATWVVRDKPPRERRSPLVADPRPPTADR